MVNNIFSPPKYEQLKDYIMEQIKKDRFPVRSQLPSEDSLANEFDVSRGTVRRALQVLEKEGIVETIHGKGTFIKRKSPVVNTKIISFVYTSKEMELFRNSFYLPILSALTKEARKRHIKVIYCPFTEDEILADEELFFSHVGEGSIVSRKIPEQVIKKYHENNIPFIYIGNIHQGTKENAVIADNYKGGYLATEYLIKSGHKKIAHISHDMDTVSGPDRLEGYLQALKDNNINVNKDLILECSSKNERKVHKKMESIENIDYTALFAASDHRAIIALDYYRKKGIKIPDEVSVIGFDNIDMPPYIGYELTTINVNKTKIGKKAIDLMNELLKSPDQKPRIITTDVSLVERQTCRKI